MKENNQNNSLNIPFNDLYSDSTQKSKSFVATNIYEQIEEKKSECN